MTNIVFKYDGLPAKLMGDAIMAIGGVPLDQPDQAQRAQTISYKVLWPAENGAVDAP